MRNTLLCLSVLSFLSSPAFTETINNNQTLSSLSASTGAALQYEFSVPNEATNIEVTLSGGNGDADLYVRAGNRPTVSTYDCRPYLIGNNESCDFSLATASIYYIDLLAYANFSDASLNVSYEIEAGNGGQTPGATWSGFNAYYTNAIGQTGQVLLNELHDASARNHNRMSYSQVWDALKYTDEDPLNTNNVILLYSGRSQSKQFSSSGNNSPDAWNREHSWPKSHGFPSQGDWAYTDIHHLRPTDASVNSTRSNKDYDEGGSEVSDAPGNYRDSDSFEPRDAVKGDVARMMFYMDIRYNGNDNTGTDDLVLVDYSGTSGGLLGDLCTLYQWHNQDPVSQQEITRHARVVERQGNRNPFIDYPAWVNQVWGPQCN